MKKFFEYIGLTVLFLFSYYYTSKIGEYMSDKNTIMVSLEEQNELLNEECVEGYINSDGVVLGISGLSINMEKSYHNMRGLGYNEDLIEYDIKGCAVNKDNSLNKYIIKGNPTKNSVSIILEVQNSAYIDNFIKIANEKNIEINLLVDDSIYNSKKDMLLNYLEKGIEILYNGNNIKEFKTYFSNTFCVYKNSDALLEACKKAKVNTIKTDKVYIKDSLSNVKSNLEKGDFIILSENKNNLTEFKLLINFIQSKGINIIGLSKHLS